MNLVLRHTVSLLAQLDDTELCELHQAVREEVRKRADSHKKHPMRQALDLIHQSESLQRAAKTGV